MVLDDVALRDTDLTMIAIWLDEVYGLRVATDNLHRAVDFVAAQHAFHRVRDWIEARAWDRVPRLDSYLSAYLLAEDTPLHRKFSSSFLIGACARVFEPGCQLDTMLMLIGRQGVGKSRLCAALPPVRSWLGETGFDIGNKDSFMALEGKWFYELAECESLNRASDSAAKAFITSRTDRYRKPYARLTEDHPRQTVFVATGNEEEVLRDPTGARRYWPVLVGEPDLAAIARDREQLFGEALVRYRAGEIWWLNREEEKLLVAAQRQFTVPEAWESALRPWVATREAPFTVEDAMRDGLGIVAERWDPKKRQRAGRALGRLGCVKTRPVGADGDRPWCWERPASMDGEKSDALAS
ncbi:MAG: virulence-associated E family protein [Pseudomonadota bacterium]|nr:virulence-associated E family protein [Pseudomonadota bacterium]